MVKAGWLKGWGSPEKMKQKADFSIDLLQNVKSCLLAFFQNHFHQLLKIFMSYI